MSYVVRGLDLAPYRPLFGLSDEELAIRGRQQFLKAGGEDFAALDCLNAGAAGMDMLEALVRRELAGWI